MVQPYGERERSQSFREISLAGVDGKVILEGRCDIEALIQTPIFLSSLGITLLEQNPSDVIQLLRDCSGRPRLSKKELRAIDPTPVLEQVREMYFSDSFVEAPEFDGYFDKAAEYYSEHIEEFLSTALLLFALEGFYAARPLDAGEDRREQTAIDCGRLGRDYELYAKRRMGHTRKMRKRRADLSNLLAFYDGSILAAVQEAKDIYKSNPNRNWKRIVKAEIHEKFSAIMPHDLICRLSGNPVDLSDEIKAKLAEQGGSSEPSDIAAEWSARMCGADRYTYKLSSLERELSIQRNKV
jgi:hypothetical protein